MSESTPTYYLRFSESEEPAGPAHLSTLKHRAALGEIDGTTLIAKSAEGPWATADHLKALELDWKIEDKDGNAFPVCHVLALRGKVERGEVQPFWEIFHLPSGEDYQVVDALCSALLEQNRLLEARLQGDLPGVLPTTEEGEDDADPRELRIRRDQAMREAAKWKRLYDDEISRNRDREEELLRQIEELRAWQRKAAERIKALERRRGQLEELMKKAPSITGGNEDRDLSRAYQELQLQLEHLIDSLHLRARELEVARDENRELSLRFSQTRADLEASLESQREIHADTLEQLSKLEQAHTDLIREYRGLNHRFVQLRNRKSTPPGDAATKASDAPAPAAPPTKLDMS
jgi:predicted  nucleic acid-binding Zn-ribbon protein